MSTLTPERWREISHYLGQALTISGEARVAWLQGIREQHPELADHLQTLLDEHYVTKDEAIGCVDEVLKHTVRVVKTPHAVALIGWVKYGNQYLYPLLVGEPASLREYALVQGSVLFIALNFVIINLIVDLIYSVIDPRISYGN